MEMCCLLRSRRLLSLLASTARLVVWPWRKPYLALAALLCLAASPARAIDITIVYDTPAQWFPSYDPDGSKLAVAVDAAAQMWESLLPGPGTFSMGVHWSPYNDGGTGPLATANSFDNSIRFRTDMAGVGGSAQWFFDSTPLVNEEFDSFTQDLYGSSSEQSWFPNGAPNLLEIGYYASGVSGGAEAGYDLLSVALHEIGHFLVVGWNDLAPPVPIPQEFIGNYSGVEVNRADDAHIGPQYALMDPFTSDSTRTLPSALDIIAAAGNYGWTDVNLKRVDWLGDLAFPNIKLWSYGPGWEGREEPSLLTHVTMRGGADLTSQSSASARSLTIRGESSLQLDNALFVTEDVTLAGFGWDEHAAIAIGPSGYLTVGTGDLSIDDADLTLQGGTAWVAGDVDVMPTIALIKNTINGHGMLMVGGRLHNAGQIKAENGTLAIAALPGGSLDLDDDTGVDAAGSLLATNGNLEFQGAIFDPFDGYAEIDVGHWMHFSDDVTFGTGTLTFDGAGPGAELVSAGNVTLGSVLQAGNQIYAIDADARIAAKTITFLKYSSAAIHASLTLDGETYYYGGFFEGTGALVQNGNAVVTGKVIIGGAGSIGTYDWDGNLATPTNTKLQPGAEFTIKADSLGGAFAGEADLGDGATLDVQVTAGFGLWELAPSGVIRFQNDGVLAGTPLTVRGGIEALGGTSRIENIVALAADSAVAIADGATLQFTGGVSYGAGVSGSLFGLLDDSTLDQWATGNVTDYHTMHLGFFNWDPSAATDSHTTIQPNATFDIRALRIGNNLPGFLARLGFGDTVDIDGGALRVVVGGDHPVLGAFPEVWRLNETGIINLAPGGHAPARIEGSRLFNDGTISGTGEVDAPLENHGLLDIGHDGAAGLITVFDVYEQHADGTLHIELGGYDAGLTFDQLRLMLTGELDGTLDVDLLAGFAPNIGDSFRVVNCSGGISGTFATLNLPGLASGQWAVHYSNLSVDLLVVPEPSSVLLLGLGALSLAARRWR